MSGGFTDYATDNCVGRDCTNPALALFNVRHMETGGDPWTTLLTAEQSTHDIDPGIKVHVGDLTASHDAQATYHYCPPTLPPYLPLTYPY